MTRMGFDDFDVDTQDQFGPRGIESDFTDEEKEMVEAITGRSYDGGRDSTTGQQWAKQMATAFRPEGYAAKTPMEAATMIAKFYNPTYGLLSLGGKAWSAYGDYIDAVDAGLASVLPEVPDETRRAMATEAVNDRFREEIQMSQAGYAAEFGPQGFGKDSGTGRSQNALSPMMYGAPAAGAGLGGILSGRRDVPGQPVNALTSMAPATGAPYGDDEYWDMLQEMPYYYARMRWGSGESALDRALREEALVQQERMAERGYDFYDEQRRENEQSNLWNQVLGGLKWGVEQYNYDRMLNKIIGLGA